MTVWRRCPTTLHRTCADRVVLLPRSAAGPLVLSSAGAAVWHALSSPGTHEEVVVRVAASFDVDPGAIRHDVEAFLDKLVELDAVRSAQ